MEMFTIRLTCKVEGVRGIHDLHIWQLADTMVIASVHVSVWECDVASFNRVALLCKEVLHRHGIHSSTVQPEFVNQSEV